MELVTAYLYNSSPLDTKGITNMTFHNLKRNGWYTDGRATKKFQIYNKRFKIAGEWYRTIIRFTQTGDTYELDMPAPFVIALTKALDESETVFKDTKVLHGRKIGNTVGYLNEGIPIELIDTVLLDVKSAVTYMGQENGPNTDMLTILGF